MPETTAKSTKIPQARKITPTLDPAVILDTVFEDGLLYITIQNILDRPAYRVSVKFHKPFFGNEGQKNITELQIFKRIEYLAPFKLIRIFIDTSEAFFQSKQSTRITGELTYTNADGTPFVSPVIHNINIYKDLTYHRT